MYLKHLELMGFKSFANKTVLDFPGGITAIVGPNGSGKSNIIDGIRWLLGEREAKNIRGAKAEDLIFAGTPQRARMGMAQITLVFDNSKKFFPVDYTEVSVTRRVTRDGVSQYLLNDAEVRLKDIIDFFAKSRLGTKGLTIVNQGNSDIFVRATSKERRIMVEEVLGLRQYQIKKHYAELKMENTRINLDKVKALIEEIAPHLRLLRRQASKYEKQADLDKELKDLEEQYFGGKLRLIEADRQALEPQISAVEKEIADRRQELKKLQADLVQVEKSGPKGDRDFESFQKKQADFLNKKAVFQKDLGRLEGQIEFLVRQPKAEIKAGEAIGLLEEVRSAIQQAILENDFSAFKDLLTQLVAKIEKTLSTGSSDRGEEIKELEREKEKIQSQLETIDAELTGLRADEGKLAENLRVFNAVFKKAFEAVEARKDEINNLDNQRNKLLFDSERIKIRHHELENLAAQSGRKLGEFKEALRGSSGQLQQIEFSEVEKRMFKLRAELAGIGELDPALIKEAQDTEARHNFLSKQSEDLEKAADDLEILINDLDEKIHDEFSKSLKEINHRFNEYFRLMFDGGHASLKLQKIEDKEQKTELNEEVSLETVSVEGAVGVDEDVDKKHKADHGGIEVSVTIPRKKIRDLEMLSGGEKSLVSIAALFALISVSPPPFLVLDEIDAPLDERNTRRFANLIKEFSKNSQFILVTHNRATMEVADILYGVTMSDDGTSRVLSLKLESASFTE